MPAQKCTKDLEEDTDADAADSGMDHRHIYIDLEEEGHSHVDISGIMIAKFENLDCNKLAHLEFPLLVDRISTAEHQYFIPDWVRNNAKWWSEGQIDDRTFANGIEFLINVGIIVV